MFSSRFSLVLLSAIFIFENANARPTFGKHGLVTSASNLASQAGIETLKRGGNAVDAAVTTAFVLAVTRPYYAALGGGGFMIVRFKNNIYALDHRERAPIAARSTMYTGKQDTSLYGGLAIGTPGNVRGLYDLWKKFGKKTWREDIAAAVEIAQNGFMVTEELARLAHQEADHFNDAAKKSLSVGGRLVETGDTLKQPALARALRIIQAKGVDGFYSGVVASDIVKSVKNTAGILTAKDLQGYQSKWREPIHMKVYGVDVFTMPPPSSGGLLMLKSLLMAEQLRLNEAPPFSSQEAHLLAEIMSRSFFDRQYMADPDFIKVPEDKILDLDRIKKFAGTIDRKKKKQLSAKDFEIPGKAIEVKNEKGSTTHYIVVDKDGNAVSATTTLNGDFGSCVYSEKFGIALNNEMDDFTTQPGKPNMFGLTQGIGNAVSPLKTPLSSMTPAIVEKGGKFWLAIGAPGGPRIINAVFQVLYHALTSKTDIDQLVQAPRVHHQYSPDTVFYDPTLSPDIVRELENRGHHLEPKTIARVYAVRVTPEGLLEGAFDARGEGGAASY